MRNKLWEWIHKINYITYFLRRVLTRLEIHDWLEWTEDEYGTVYRECALCTRIQNPDKNNYPRGRKDLEREPNE